MPPYRDVASQRHEDLTMTCYEQMTIVWNAWDPKRGVCKLNIQT